MQNSSTIIAIWWLNLDNELSDSLDKVIYGVDVGSFGVVGVDGVDDVGVEGLVVVLDSLSPCLDVVGSDGLDGVFEGDFVIASQSAHFEYLIPSYVSIWLHDFFFVVSHRPYHQVILHVSNNITLTILNML